MSNLDALLQLRPQPDVDGPGFFSDGDMLQVRLQTRIGATVNCVHRAIIADIASPFITFCTDVQLWQW
jgi:hypothetical protein